MKKSWYIVDDGTSFYYFADVSKIGQNVARGRTSEGEEFSAALIEAYFEDKPNE